MRARFRVQTFFVSLVVLVVFCVPAAAAAVDTKPVEFKKSKPNPSGR